MYDFVFYLAHGTPMNLPHLAAKLEQTGRIESAEGFTLDDAKGLLRARFSEINYDQAKTDVRPFIATPASLDVWSADFFCSLVDAIRA